MRNAKQQLKQQTALSSLLLTLTLVCTLVLAGCGGGGAAVMPTPDPMPGETPPPKSRDVLVNALKADAALAEGTDIRIRRAARSARRGVSSDEISGTTQSSYSFNGQTTETMIFSMDYDENGDLHFTATERLTNINRAFTLRSRFERASIKRLNDAPVAGWKGVERTFEGDTSNTYMSVYSDIQNNADTDYLAMGIWVFGIKSDDGSYSGFRTGTATSGNDPFDNDGLPALTGTATYEGPATGLYMSKANANAAPAFDYFNATARLTADFGDASAPGRISGSITGGMTDGGGALPDLTLGSADIEQARTGQGGNFQGETGGMTGNGVALSGIWGGKFFGNGANAAEHPGSVAGTFGGNSADDLMSILGSFGAYKQ